MRIKPLPAAVTAAALATTGTLIALTLTTTPARAATSACGSSCADIYPESTGSTDILTDNPSGTAQSPAENPPCGPLKTTCYYSATGDAVIAAASGSSSTEDWSLKALGTVDQFYKAGLLRKIADMRWPSDQAYEIQYTPGGKPSGTCLAPYEAQIQDVTGTSDTSSSTTSSTSFGPYYWAAVSGADVGLTSCGVDDETLWIFDKADADSNGAMPLIPASNQNFSMPVALTAGAAGSTLTLRYLKTGGASSTPASDQMWKITYGSL